MPARSVVTVDVDHSGPDRHQYAVRVTARDVDGRRVPVVAELLASWPPSSTSTGRRRARQGTTRRRPPLGGRRCPTTTSRAIVTVLNPGTEPVTAELLVYDGATDRSATRRAAPSRPAASRLFAVESLAGGGRVRGRHAPTIRSSSAFTLLGDAGGVDQPAIPDSAGDGGLTR